MEVYNSTAVKNTFDSSRSRLPGIINDYQLELFEIVNFVCLCSAISLFGIPANIINIIIFFKQGFSNTVNISFCALAVSDLCCLISLLWVGIWLNPFMSKSDVPVVAIEFQYLTGVCPHAVCGRITSYITVYVTAERCLCILLPLRIKQCVTPTKTVVVVCSIFIINILTIVPEYTTSFFHWKLFPDTNRTLLAIAYGSGREQALPVMFFMFFFTGILSFVALISFTIILVAKLQQSSEWRQKVTSASGQHVANRDKKTVKLIVVIATVLIVCYSPGAAISMYTFVEPEFYFQGLYSRLCISLWSVAFVLNAVNSSINIVLYYKMSSNYRQTFNTIFAFIRSGSSI